MFLFDRYFINKIIVIEMVWVYCLVLMFWGISKYWGYLGVEFIEI